MNNYFSLPMIIHRWKPAVAFILVMLLMAMAGGVFAAEPATVDHSGVTPAQARHTLSILQDDAKRTELEQTLNAIAQASEPAAPAFEPPAAAAEEAPIALTEGGLLSQLLAATTQRLHAVADWFRLSGRSVSGMGSMGHRWQEAMSSPEQRSAVLIGLLKVIVIFAAALLVEWLLGRLMARAHRLLKRGVPSDASAATVLSAPAEDRYLSLLRRIPFALGRCVLKLLPLLGFLAAASVLASAFTEHSSVPYAATLIIIEAYATTRISLAIIQLIVSPDEQGLRLVHISDAAAIYVNRWLSWIVVIAVFGMAAVNMLPELGASLDTRNAFSKLVGLVVHLLLLVMVWHSRKTTAVAIRGTGANPNLFGIRRVAADVWPVLATVFIVGVWLLWSAGTQNGFERLIHFFAWSTAVIVGASLISIFLLGAIDRVFIRNREEGQTLPAGTRNVYQLLVRRAIYIVITIVTALVLLQVWGLDTWAWFKEGSVGRRLASAAVTIAITCFLAVLAWESLNIAINRRLDKWREAGDIARAARLRTLVPMVRTALFVIIAMIVLFTALSQLGVNIAPLLAGASIIGVALGFGSQKLVQDFITGIFLLMENAMQVGDWVTVAGLSGSVEYLSIRTVRLRAGDGSLHVVPFSSVSTVTNTNRGLGNASVRVSVTADANVEEVYDALKSVGADMRADPKFKDLILADLDIWGVDQVDGSMITIAGQIRTLDKGRWPVQREFNRRILLCFREREIQFVNPKETRIIGAGS